MHATLKHVVLAASLLIAGAAGPAAWSGPVPAIGTVEGRGAHFTSSPGVCVFYLDFVGRMPAGAKTYQVLFGKMTTSRSCDPTYTMTMHGTTLSGYFDWTCLGSLSTSFSCTSVQKGGTFKLIVRVTEMEVPQEPPGHPTKEFTYQGTYRAREG